MGNCSGHWNNWSKDDNGKFERSDRRFFCSNCHFEKKHNGSCECSMRKDDKKDDKKEEKCHIDKQKKCKCRDEKNNGKKVLDFQYDLARPNIFVAGGTQGNIALPVGSEVPQLAIAFNDVQEDSVIELKGILHITGGAADGTVIVRIRRVDNTTGVLLPGTVIYQTPLLRVETADTIAIPVLHVDENFMRCTEHVTYVLTAEAGTTALTSNPPRTFTGTEYN